MTELKSDKKHKTLTGKYAGRLDFWVLVARLLKDELGKNPCKPQGKERI